MPIKFCIRVIFGSSGMIVGEKGLKALILLRLCANRFAIFLRVDMEPLADVICQPCSQPCPKREAGCKPGYHIALSM